MPPKGLSLAASDVEAEVIDKETALLASWRITQLTQAGYDPVIAGVLSSIPSLDWRRAVALRAAGCTPLQAWRILRD